MTFLVAAGFVLSSAVSAGAQTGDPGTGQTAPETSSPTTQPPETNPPETQPPETKPPETTAPKTNPPSSSTPPPQDQQRSSALEVAPLAAPGDNLTVTIRKQTTPDGAPQPFQFVLQKCNIGSTGTCNSNQANWVTVPNGTQSIADGGVFTWGNDNTAPGTFDFSDVRYRVLETVPGGWNFVNLTSCSDGLPNFTTPTTPNPAGASFRFQDSSGDRSFDCTWNNAQANVISVTKQTSPDGSPTTFPFQLERCNNTSGTTCTSFGPPQFVSPNPQTIGDGQSAAWTGLEIDRVYRLTETVPGGWTVTGRDCAGGAASTNTGNNGQIIRLDNGNPTQLSASCTFTDTTPSISVTKQTNPDGSQQQFPFSLELCTETTGTNCTGAVSVAAEPAAAHRWSDRDVAGAPHRTELPPDRVRSERLVQPEPRL